MTAPRPGSAGPPGPGGPECRFCASPITPHQAASGAVCGTPHCEMRRVQEAARRVFHRDWNSYCGRQRQSARAAGVDLAAALRLLESPPETIAIGAVPRLDRPLVPLPEARRTAFAAHLDAIVDEAFAGGEPAPDLARRETAEPPEHPLVAATCAGCTGACCMIGGIRNAFLGAETVQLYRARNPSARPSEITAHFLSRLPERSVEHSCVYHGEQGCALSRRERADIFNRYHCNPQTDLLRRYRDMGARQAIVVACEDGTGPTAVLFDAGRGWWPLPAGAADGIGAEEIDRAVAAALAQVPPDLPGEPQAAPPPVWPGAEAGSSGSAPPAPAPAAGRTAGDTPLPNHASARTEHLAGRRDVSGQKDR